MRKMKDSGIEWIGDIPEHWETKAIRFIISKHFGGSWGNDAKNNSNDRICMRIADFDYPRIKFKENLNYTIRNYLNSDIENKTLKYGDLLIEKSGGGDKNPVGRTVVYRLSYNAIFANFMECIRLKSEYNVEYVKYIMFAIYSKGVTNLYFNQTTGLQNLNIPKFFREVNITIPPIEEQQKIAAYLDEKCTNIDYIISGLKKQTETLADYKKSLITETVTKGLNPDAEMKNSGIDWIGDIPEHWEVKRLKYLINSSLQYGANETGIEYDEKLPRYIRITDITSDNQLKENGKLSLPYEIAKTYLLQNNDILFARSGATVGKSFIYKSKYGACAFAGYLIKASIKRTVSPDFVYYYTLGAHYDLWKDRVFTQATIQNIGADKYVNLPVVVPPMEEQQKIAEYLDKKCTEIDGIISGKKKQIKTMEEYKKSLIYEIVTGKIKV